MNALLKQNMGKKQVSNA